MCHCINIILIVASMFSSIMCFPSLLDILFMCAVFVIWMCARKLWLHYVHFVILIVAGPGLMLCSNPATYSQELKWGSHGQWCMLVDDWIGSHEFLNTNYWEFNYSQELKWGSHGQWCMLADDWIGSHEFLNTNYWELIC